MSEYLLIDTETSGLLPATSDVIEIGACALAGDLTLAGPEFHRLIRPTLPVAREAINVNGHTWALDPDSPGWTEALEPRAAWLAFEDWIREHYGTRGWIVMVGWNVGFDHAQLKMLCDRAAGWWPFHFQTLDLLTVCRYLDIRADRSRRSYRLDALAKELGGVPKDGKLHTAMTDAKTCLAVLERFEDMGR